MSHFSGELWPVHPQRLPDELLSFWILRVAHANRVKLQTFTNATFGRNASPWTRDIDRSASTEFVERLSLRTGAAVADIKEGMLSSYEGIAFERHNKKGNTPWILPLGIYHRTRRSNGMQFCPQCLFWDTEPYFRRRWRLAFATICDKHGTLLHDRCPQCQAPVIFFRNDLGHRRNYNLGNHTLCWQCGFNLRVAPTWGADWLDAETYIALRSLLTFIDDGLGIAGGHCFSYANLFLEVLHRMCEMLASGGNRRRHDCLQAAVSNSTGLSLPPASGRVVFERLGIAERHRILLSALWLLMDWPNRFVATCLQARLTRSFVFGDLTTMPFWFDSRLGQFLDKSLYIPNEEEARNVVTYLEKCGQTVSRRLIVQILGGKRHKVADRFANR